MRNRPSASGSQAPRVLKHPGPFNTPEWIAYAAMAVANNNGIKVVSMKPGARVPLEASIVIINEELPVATIKEIQDCDPTFTIITKRDVVLSDYMPTLISAVCNNRHAAIIVTSPDRLGHWASIAGANLVHIAVDDPIGFFGDVIGGAA